jgi:uncharacterized protein (DUF1778 family)
MSDNPLLVGAQFLGLDNDAKFQQQVLTDPYLQAAVTALGQVLERAPEVEVTSTHVTHADVMEALGKPLERRRSGAKNVSDPHLQNAFISEARHSMGQPSLEIASALVGQEVTLTFNVDWEPVTGILSTVMQPSHGPAYVMLDNDTKPMYPLNSIQEIKSA